MKLVICEKNIAASRIASILSKGSFKRKNISSVPVYEFDYDNDRWRVVGLRGHIIKVDYRSVLMHGKRSIQRTLYLLNLRRR